MIRKNSKSDVVVGSRYAACFMVATTTKKRMDKKVVITTKKSDRNTILITLPVDFDLDNHIAQFPPAQYEGFFELGSVIYSRWQLKFSKDKIYFFLGLLSSIPARNSDIVKEDGFVPINQKPIRDGIRDINYYADYLKNTGVIECDDDRVVGSKSYGYKWGKKYSSSLFSTRRIECIYADFDTLKNTKYINTLYNSQYTEFPYLFHWYQQKKLMIDTAANSYAFQICQAKMNDPTKEGWDLNNKEEKKHPASQYHSALLNIYKIQDLCYEAHIDDNVHRLHSALTGLGTKYRQYVNYNDKKLVGIDITNSQPYIISLILNREFWSENSSLPLNITHLPNKIRLALMEGDLPVRIKKFFNSVEDNTFTEYKALVSSGKFYENVVEIATGLGKTITRDEAKILMFYTMYSSNYQPKDPFLKQMRGIFKDMFPKVAELFQIIKRNFDKKNFIGEDANKQHNRLARLLQSIESNIVLHKCCKRIWEEGNQQVPVFTIHDNIVTTEGNKDLVRTIMYEELERYIGLAPPLSEPEIWQ